MAHHVSSRPSRIADGQITSADATAAGIAKKLKKARVLPCRDIRVRPTTLPLSRRAFQRSAAAAGWAAARDWYLQDSTNSQHLGLSLTLTSVQQETNCYRMDP